MHLDHYQIFKITVLAMRFNFSHPDIKRDLKWFLKFLFTYSISTSVFMMMMYNMVFIDLKGNDFTKTCKNGTLAMLHLVITFEYCIILWKQRYFKELITFMIEDYELSKQLPANEQEIVIRYAKRGEDFCKFWLALGMLVFGSFLAKNIFWVLYYYWVEGELRKIALYDLVFPPLIENNRENTYVFILIYIMLFYYGAYSTLTMTAFVPLGPGFMLHACGQIEVVERRMEALFENDNIDEVTRNLKNIVKQLQYIYGFVDRIKSCYRVAYELTLKAGMIVLPITSYEVIESVKKGEDVSLEFVTFIIGAIFLCSCPCYYSEILMGKSEDLRLAMYSCGWEKMYNRGIRSIIKILLLRALEPMAIRSLFRTVCLEALTDLYQQSYTIFNLMNAVFE